jgi:hypothetical protein
VHNQRDCSADCKQQLTDQLSDGQARAYTPGPERW